MMKEIGDIMVATLPCGFLTVRGQKFKLVPYKIQHHESHQHNLELNRTKWHAVYRHSRDGGHNCRLFQQVILI